VENDCALLQAKLLQLLCGLMSDSA